MSEENHTEDRLLNAEEAREITRHGSLRAFYRWARANKGVRSRQGFYSRAAIVRAIRPKSPVNWKGSAR